MMTTHIGTRCQMEIDILYFESIQNKLSKVKKKNNNVLGFT